ncbi:MAG: glycine--tRNA ligase [Mycoplasmataceae bacterium]|nr:glycine--tRNA ligase [Mycoplasmataceae bacterium]
MKEQKEIVAYLKDKGFIYPGSDIYGGLANSWDYGPLGAILKDNIKQLWKKTFIDEQHNVFHLDSSIILNSKVWKASGHIDRFSDPLVDCKSCKQRYRADDLLKQANHKNVSTLSLEELTKGINKLQCPNCSKQNWTNVREFNLMFKMSNSKINLNDDEIYLRPETAQGVFINFKNIMDTISPKLPFGVGQVGKAFRNEVTPGNFIFRTKEFDQLELEFFCHPNDANKWFKFYNHEIQSFLKNTLNLKSKYIKEFHVPTKELAHYSTKTIDFEFKFPFGWAELLGLANRTDYDLKTHSEHSNDELLVIDPITKEKYTPYVIETSIGVERLLFAIVSNHLKTIIVDDEERDILQLPFALAPIKIAIAPLTNKIEKQAFKLYEKLLKDSIGSIIFIKGGSIGKRYRKQDQIGTPFVITYDFDSQQDHQVTIRERDSKKQTRVKIDEITTFIQNHAK